MKNGAELFKHLPFASNKKVEFFLCLNKLKKLLPPSLCENVIGGYVKNETLFFLLKDKTLEFEANYKLNSLTPILKEFVGSLNECSDVSFTKVKAYAKSYTAAQKPQTTFLEKERSEGTFDNLATSESLKIKIEQIRKEILKNASKN